MGHINQLYYLSGVRKKGVDIKGPTLEVGSKDYGSNVPFRKVLNEYPYTGLDMEKGKGVDVVHDLTTGPGPLEGEKYNLIICCSILEHVSNPWEAAKTLTDLLADDGHIYISVPWVQRFHGYPDDYWRFSFSGLKMLFPDLTLTHPTYSTFTEGEFRSIDKNLNLSIISDGRRYLPCLELHVIGSKNKV